MAPVQTQRPRESEPDSYPAPVEPSAAGLSEVVVATLAAEVRRGRLCEIFLELEEEGGAPPW